MTIYDFSDENNNDGEVSLNTNINKTRYKIIYCGELQPGHDLLSVKSRLASMLGLSMAEIEKLFIDKPILLKKGVPLIEAQEYKLNLERLGARCYMLEENEQFTGPTPLESIHQDQSIQNTPASRLSNLPAGHQTSTHSNLQFQRNVPLTPISYTRPIIFAVIVCMAILIYFFSYKKISISNTGTDKTVQKTAQQSKPIFSPPPFQGGKSKQAVEPSVIQPDESSSDTAKTDSLISSDNLENYTDPKGFYTLTLPSGYRIENKSSGDRSKISFIYPGGNNLVILSHKQPSNWNAAQDMEKKVGEIKSGKAGPLSQFSVAGYGMVEFRGLTGYSIQLEKEGHRMIAYALISPGNTFFSIAIETQDPNGEENLETLDNSVRDSLSYF